jgi:hypothetical protein
MIKQNKMKENGNNFIMNIFNSRMEEQPSNFASNFNIPINSVPHVNIEIPQNNNINTSEHKYSSKTIKNFKKEQSEDKSLKFDEIFKKFASKEPSSEIKLEKSEGSKYDILLFPN